MWIYPDKVIPEGHKAQVGDIVVATIDEYGTTEQKVGVVVEAAARDDCVDIIVLKMVDPDNLEFYG